MYRPKEDSLHKSINDFFEFTKEVAIMSVEHPRLSRKYSCADYNALETAVKEKFGQDARHAHQVEGICSHIRTILRVKETNQAAEEAALQRTA